MPGTYTAMFDPADNFDFNSQYSISLNALVKDININSLNLFNSSFITKFFEDLFDRSDSTTVGNNWEHTPGFSIGDSQLHLNGVTQYCYQNIEAYNVAKTYEIYFTIYGDGTHYCGQRSVYFHFDATDSDHPTQSLGVLTSTPSGIAIGINSYSNRLDVYDADDTSRLTDIFWTWTPGTKYSLRINIYSGNIKIKIWESSAEEPESWNLNYDKGSDFNTSGGGYYGWFLRFASEDHVWFDDLNMKKY